jgi:hypothetical protein
MLWVFLLLLLTTIVRPVLIQAEPSANPDVQKLAPFEPLHAYHGGKLVLSLLLAGTAATDPGASDNERLIVGGSAVLLGLPAAAVLYHSRRGHTTATRRWQLASFVADLALAGSLAGYGTFLIAEGTTSNQWAGLAALSTGVLGIVASRLDLMPFRRIDAASKID